MDAARSLGVEAQLLRVPNHASQELLESLFTSHFGGVDRIMIAAHGPAGGSGKIHRAARACGLSVLGPEPRAIAAAYDKLVCRQRLAFHNLPVPRTVAVSADRGASTRELERLGWPAILKPRRGAFGAGVRPISSVAELDATLSACAPVQVSLEPEFLVERRIAGREISVVLLDGEVLGMAEQTRTFGPAGASIHSMTCPPDLDEVQRRGLANLAALAAKTLGMVAGPTRVDLMLSGRDNELILEVEPLPAVHRDSLVARVARAEGLIFTELFARMLAGPRTQRTRQAQTRAPAQVPVHAR